MKVYLAGPMTGIPEFNFPAFDEAAATLRSHGYVVISPAEMDRADGFNEKGKTGHEPLRADQRRRFARNDIAALLEVDAVFVLPGWENSTGAQNETRIAAMLGVPTCEYARWEVDGEHTPYIAIDGTFSGHDITPTPERNHRADVLLTAEELVNGDRNAQYGDPRQDFQRTATMWSAYLGTEVAPHDVAALMALLKVSRIRWSPQKQDSWIDLAGYAACGWDCAAPA